MAIYKEYWVDYSAGKISGAAMAASVVGPNGEKCTGAIRYIDAPNLLSTKHTNKAEYDDLLAHGLKVRLVHQGTTTDADGGFQAGVNRAQRAKAGADYLGYPGVIIFTNDRPELPNPATWQAYLDGAASVLGRERVGAYGFDNALNAAQGHALAFWQSGRESDLVPHANYYQWNNGRVYIDGTECDLNKVVSDYDYGFRAAVGPVRRDEEDEMQPKEMPVSLSAKEVTLPWDGREAVLDVVGTGTDVFVGQPWNWGNNGGTGGGLPTNPSLPRAGDGWRVTANLPGAFRIPAGTKRVVHRYSCGSTHFVQINPV